MWLGNEKEKAKELFWNKVHKFVSERYTMAPVQVTGKLNAFYKAASQRKLNLVNSEENFITRIRVDNLDNLMTFKYNSGFFFEYDAQSIDEILPLCDYRCQTLTYCGMETYRIRDFIFTSAPRGIDRVVPMGKSMDFALIWDGHDLIREMSRYVSI